MKRSKNITHVLQEYTELLNRSEELENTIVSHLTKEDNFCYVIKKLPAKYTEQCIRETLNENKIRPNWIKRMKTGNVWLKFKTSQNINKLNNIFGNEVEVNSIVEEKNILEYERYNKYCSQLSLSDDCEDLDSVTDADSNNINMACKEESSLSDLDENDVSGRINVVIKKIPIKIKEEEIREELKAKSFDPIAIHRMQSFNKWPINQIPMVLVQLPATQSNIFDLREFMHQEVIVEALRDSYPIIQCEQCDTFGHTIVDCVIEEDSDVEDCECSCHLIDTGDTDLDKQIEDTETVLPQTLRIVLKGIPIVVSESIILKDLQDKHFQVNEVYRLTDSNNKPSRLITFQLPKEQDHIYYLNCCAGYRVTVEDLRTSFPCTSATYNRDCSDSAEPIIVLLRGIPREISEELVVADLKKKGFNPTVVHRMIRRTRTATVPLPIMIVQVPSSEDHIHSLKCCLGFSLRIELFVRSAYELTQCAKCNQFHTKRCDTYKDNSDVSSVPIDPPVNFVIKGLPIELKVENIMEDLRRKSFTPIAIHRMEDSDSRDLPMVLVQLPQYQKRYIFFMSCCLGFNVTIENLRPEYEVAQCQLCKQFGHEEAQCSNSNSGKLQKEFISMIESNFSKFILELPQQYSQATVMSMIMNKLVSTIMAPCQAVVGMLKNDSLDPRITIEMFKSTRDSILEMLVSVIGSLESTVDSLTCTANSSGAPSHIIDEAIHLLEELEGVKEHLRGTPLWPNYDRHFPQLS